MGKYRNKLQQKETQIYNLNIRLEEEISNRMISIEEEEQRKENKRSEGMQTEPDQDYLMLIQDNQLKNKELSQTKIDITTVLDSYDKLKEDFSV